MAKSKVTITVDRGKVDQARQLVGASSTSEAIDVALDRMIHAERLRGDVAAYIAVPTTEDEASMAGSVTFAALDDTDWESLYDGLNE